MKHRHPTAWTNPDARRPLKHTGRQKIDLSEALQRVKLNAVVIEPELERIPVLEAVHSERHNGRDFRITQTVRRNVFTEFDRRLSRHLAATRGTGFPTFTVSIKVADVPVPGTQFNVAPARMPDLPICRGRVE